MLQIQLSGALNPTDADNRAAYLLFSGTTKKGKTVYSSRLKFLGGRQ